MWPLLFLLLASSGPAEALGAGVGMTAADAPTSLIEARAAVDDGTRRWATAARADSGVRRRRAPRHLRLRVRRPPLRTVRTGESDARRRADLDASLRIQRAAAVARRVARAWRSAHTPSRIGFSDARPPAA